MKRSMILRFIAVLAFLVVALMTTSSHAVTVAADNPSGRIHILHTRDWHKLRPALSRSGASNNLIYNGGPVMHTVKAYAIYWAPTGYSIPSDYESLINRYFQDVGGSSFYNINTQYYDNPGPTYIQNNSTFGGAWIDTTNAYPHAGTTSDPLLDSDIQAEVQRATNQNNWPTDLTNTFFVFTAYGVESCFDGSQSSCTPGIPGGNGYCAYHGFFTLGSHSVIYANMPYGETWTDSCRGFYTSPNGDLAADGEISTSSHEHFEAVTDPLVNAWYDSSGFEIGDKCAYDYGTTTSDGHNIILKNNEYIVQQEWSNADSGCALSLIDSVSVHDWLFLPLILK